MPHYLLTVDDGLSQLHEIRPLTFDEAEKLGLDGTLRGIEAPVEERVSFNFQIPGEVWAFYDCGEIQYINFTPHAGSAGYFGPSVIPDPYLTPALEGMDLESPDGPLWRAIQKYLETSRIGWNE